MGSSFHTADRQTYRRIAVVGFLFCMGFVTISFSLRPQAGQTRAAIRADGVTHTAGMMQPAD